MPRAGAAEPGSPVDRARLLLWQRRLREDLLGRELFGEPAWDLLLELYVARGQQRQVSVLSASIAAATSVAMASHWLARLEEHHLVRRLFQGPDEASTIVALTDDGSARMTRLLSDMSLAATRAGEH